MVLFHDLDVDKVNILGMFGKEDASLNEKKLKLVLVLCSPVEHCALNMNSGMPFSYMLFLLFQDEFWVDPGRSMSKAYEKTDRSILSDSSNLGRGGSTAVTAILINGQKLWVANVGDSRAVLSRGGKATQMTIDHEPGIERGSIEDKGGFVSNMPGLSSFIIIIFWET